MGKVWLSCNYFLLHILMILHKTDNFHSSPVMADSSDDPLSFSRAWDKKHKEPTGLTLHILCLYFSHTGRRCSSYL